MLQGKGFKLRLQARLQGLKASGSGQGFRLGLGLRLKASGFGLDSKASG